MGKLRDWLRGDGDRPRWSRLQYAVAACAEGLQDELRDEWNGWTSNDFTGYGSEDEFDSCSECGDDEAVDRAREWLGWSPIDREADGYSEGDERVHGPDKTRHVGVERPLRQDLTEASSNRSAGT